MKEKDDKGIVPEQHTGKAIDVESSIELVNDKDAKTFFNIVKSRLEDVNNWHKYAGNITAEFKLVDKTGVEVQRKAQKGDYFKIDIPGPGSVSGKGYDWVQIEEVECTSTADDEQFGFRVRPAQNPQKNSGDIAHFYSPESTSSFTVTREKNKVTAAIYDRNMKTNKETDSVADKVRDAVVGTAGLISFSKIQWQNLADGLLNIDQ
jgi:hypothetical protein